jgi:hypothetical protein
MMVSSEYLDDLCNCLRECADDLARELDGRYHNRCSYPIVMVKWKRDMMPVERALQLLAKIGEL